MNEHMQDNNQVGDQPPKESQPILGDETPAVEGQSIGEQPPAPHPEKAKLNPWQFAIGFLGWFAVGLLDYTQRMDVETLIICGGALFIVNVGVLILLLIKLRSVGLGMLFALVLNFVLSLVFGLAYNAMCLIPFYKRP